MNTFQFRVVLILEDYNEIILRYPYPMAMIIDPMEGIEGEH